jgi:hypothetical protein
MEGKWTQQMFIEACKAEIKGKTLQLLLDATKELPELYGGLGLCLSEEGDKLGQWRGYADDGHGFCIGFNTSQLRALSDTVKFDGQPCQLVKVAYDRDAQLSRMRDLVKGLKNWWATEFPMLRGGDPRAAISIIEEFSKSAFERIDRKLPPYLYAMKNPAFEEEAEWRMVVTYSAKSVNPDLRYQAGRNKISPYITMPLGAGGGGISEVIVGPKNITPLAVIEGFLGQRAITADVRLSTATYR